MELKILSDHLSDNTESLQNQESCCQSPKITYALVWKVEPTSDPEPPPSSIEEENQISEHDDDQKKNVDDLKTPTSAAHIIQQVLTCPPAPKKPKSSAPLRKRKESHSRLQLDLSDDVLSLYPPTLLADFNKKLKKARTEDHLNKENISTAR